MPIACLGCNEVYLKGYEHCPHCGKETTDVDELETKVKEFKKYNNKKTGPSCPHCDSINPEGAVYCRKCGLKINRKLSTTALLLILLLGLAGLLLPTRVTSYEAYVPYEDLEEYIERVPYVTTEEYVEDVPVEEQEAYEEEQCTPRSARHTRDISSEWLGSGWVRVSCEINNLEDDVLTYSYTIFAGYTEGVQENAAPFKYGPYNLVVGAKTRQTVYATFNLGNSRYWYNCNVRPPTIQECAMVTRYRTVISYEPVVKTADVEKYRDETKYRKVKKTRLEVKYKEVNWIFGFDAIVRFRRFE